LILIANLGYEKITGAPLFTSVTMETLTYHGLGLGFVAVALKLSDKKHNKNARRDIFNSGLTTVSSYLLQGLLGLAITLGLSYVLGNWASSGLLLPMGFGQGPGQAYNWGHIYATATDYPAFENGSSFGLTIAAMGFVSAALGGVIYLNILKRKGRVRQRGINADEVEDLTAHMVTKKGEIPMTESLDKLTVQVGLVFFTYMAAYVLMFLASIGLDSLGGFFAGTVKPLIWGFNFLIGTVLAIIVRLVLGRLQQRGVIKRQYINNFMLSRISGVMFDIMVVASIAAISLSAFRHREFIIPLVIVCVVGATATFLQVRFITKRLFPNYQDEAFLSMYGMLTGTASTGVILVREIDPLFETPAASNLIYQQLWAIVFGFPMLLLLGLSPLSTSMTWLTLGALVVLYIIINLLLFRRQIFGRRRAQG
jgi:ESS family glutamate:Na+ symporter